MLQTFVPLPPTSTQVCGETQSLSWKQVSPFRTLHFWLKQNPVKQSVLSQQPVLIRCGVPHWAFSQLGSGYLTQTGLSDGQLDSTRTPFLHSRILLPLRHFVSLAVHRSRHAPWMNSWPSGHLHSVSFPGLQPDGQQLSPLLHWVWFALSQRALQLEALPLNWRTAQPFVTQLEAVGQLPSHVSPASVLPFPQQAPLLHEPLQRFWPAAQHFWLATQFPDSHCPAEEHAWLFPRLAEQFVPLQPAPLQLSFELVHWPPEQV
jgi:hypothetical protein